MNFESQLKMPTPEEKMKNYEKDADERARKERSVFEKLLGKRPDTEGRIIADAQIEDKYRDLAKQGIISKEELEVITRSNLRKSSAKIREVGNLAPGDVIEGVVNGSKVKVMKIFAGKGFRSYSGTINSEKLDSGTARIIYEELEKELDTIKGIKRKEVKGIIEKK